MKEKIKGKRGITLIALVVTIIVLLILAGVAISTLTGDNGVLTQSQQATAKTNKESELETIRLAVAGSFNNGGKLDLTTLVNNLTNEMPSGTIIETEKDNEENDIFPVTVTAKYGKYTIDGNGKAEEVSGVEISPKQLKLLSGTTGNLIVNLFGDFIGKAVTWTATDGAKFDNDETTATGLSVAVKAITGKITAEAGSKNSECTVTVVENVQSAEGLTSLSGMATKTLNLSNKITNKDSIEDITYSLDSTNTTTTGASVDNTTGIVNLGDFTTVDSAKVTVILTGVLSNLTKSVEITVIPLEFPKVGDFVDYDAGKWTQKEIDVLNDAGLYSVTQSDFKFSGFGVGSDRNASMYSTPSNIKYGWRILKINLDGTIDIIHAGLPEGYTQPHMQRYIGFKSQYILGGGINPLGVTAFDYTQLNVRNFKEYSSGKWAIEDSGRLVKDSDLNLISTNDSLRYLSNNLTWFPEAYDRDDGADLRYDYPGHTISFGSSGYLGGIRPIVTLQSGIDWTSKDSTHTTYETRWIIEE